MVHLSTGKELSTISLLTITTIIMTMVNLSLKTTSKELSTKEDEVEAAIVEKPRGWSSWASTI